MENDNVFVIDKEKNEGLAINANLGIGMAKGEYVILVDNDDIIPDYAYEKLYNKAKETDSDICIGKANFIVMGNQYEMSHYECSVWDDERVISDINEFPSIFHDAFYWNKIIRKDLLVENNIILPPGMIYADRSYSHNAYVKANRIAIIPDCVYMWRIGKDSLSSNRENISNYINKIESYQLDWKYISQYHKDYIKYLIRRILLPIQGIVHDNKFEEYYFTTVYDMLIDAKNLVDDIYDNDLNNLFNIDLYLTLLIFAVDKPTKQFIPEFYKSSSEENRKRFVSSIGYRLRNMDTETKLSWWNSWLKRFIENRKSNKPVELTESECRSLFMLKLAFNHDIINELLKKRWSAVIQ